MSAIGIVKRIISNFNRHLAIFAAIKEHWYLFPGFVISLTTSLAKRSIHSDPHSVAGMYLLGADAIRSNMFVLPYSIPLISPDGLPFAYPPLGMYVLAIPLSLGIDALTITRVIPPVFVVSTAAAASWFEFQRSQSEIQAAVVGILIGVLPATAWYHLRAGGIVRAQAYFYSVGTLGVTAHHFRTGASWSKWSASVLASATALTHPIYAVFTAASLVLLVSAQPINRTTIRSTASIAAVSTALICPWVLFVTVVHGSEVFLYAAETHGGAIQSFINPLQYYRIETAVVSPKFSYSLVLIGALYAAYRHDWFAVLWPCLIGFTVSRQRFSLLAAVILVAPLIARLPSVGIAHFLKPNISRQIRTVITVGSIVCLLAVPVTGGITHQPTLESVYDGDDQEATDWVQSETKSDARFIVSGNRAEMFPMFAKRTRLSGSWGAEWEGKFHENLAEQKAISECLSPECFTAVLKKYQLNPTHIYFRKDTIQIPGGGQRRAAPEMIASTFDQTKSYEVIYENEEVLIIEVENKPK
ncbi:hypothetical protein [Haloarcula brevis]|uniref:hypothetical protein n=1 Tax=Haloarcula brevis TaxID=3111453 RepID=UPI00300E8066